MMGALTKLVPSATRILLLGLGAGVLLDDVQRRHSHAIVDVVELDQVLYTSSAISVYTASNT